MTLNIDTHDAHLYLLSHGVHGSVPALHVAAALQIGQFYKYVSVVLRHMSGGREGSTTVDWHTYTDRQTRWKTHRQMKSASDACTLLSQAPFVQFSDYTPLFYLQDLPHLVIGYEGRHCSNEERHRAPRATARQSRNREQHTTQAQHSTREKTTH